MTELETIAFKMYRLIYFAERLMAAPECDAAQVLIKQYETATGARNGFVPTTTPHTN